MAKIPRYQQGALESSMVGTPGINTAPASAFQSASRAFDTVTSAIYDVAETDYRLAQQEAQRIRSEQRAAQKELQTLQYENAAGGYKAQHATALNDMDNQMRQDYQWDTAGAMQAWNEKAQEMMDDRLEGITDPKLMLMTKKALQAEQATKQQQFGDWINSRVPDISKANVAKIGDSLKLSVNNADLQVSEVKDMLGAFAEDPANRKAYYNSYGQAAGVEMRKAQSDAARNYLAQTANNGDLNQLNERIGQFKDIIEGTDTEEFYARQRALANQVKVQNEQQQEYQVAVVTNESLAELKDKSANSTLTPNDVDNAVANMKASNATPGAIRAARAIGTQFTKDLQNQAEKVVTQQDRENLKLKIEGTRKQLSTDYNKLIGTHKGQIGPKKGTSAKQLGELYANIDEAEIQGHITPDGANAMRRNVQNALKVFDKKEPAAAARAKTMMQVSDNIIKAARTYTNDPEVNKVFGVKFNNVFFDHLDRWEKQTGKQASTQQMQNLMNSLLPKVLQDAKGEVERAKADRQRRVQAQMKNRQ